MRPGRLHRRPDHIHPCDQGPPPGGLSLYDVSRVLTGPKHPYGEPKDWAEVSPMTPDRNTADKLHAALAALNAQGSVRVMDCGQWVVRIHRGVSRRPGAYPPADQEEREQWLAVLTDQLEAAAGVRPTLELAE